MDGDGSFDPDQLVPLLADVTSGRADIAVGRRRPVAPRGLAVARPRRQRTHRGLAAPPHRHGRPRHRADAGVPTPAAARPRSAGPPVRLPGRAAAGHHPSRLAGQRARRGLPPASRGHPLQGVRLGAGHGPHGARLRAGPASRGPANGAQHEGAARRQGARRRRGEDPAGCAHRRRIGPPAWPPPLSSTPSTPAATPARRDTSACRRPAQRRPGRGDLGRPRGLDDHAAARRRLRRAPGRRARATPATARSSRSAWTRRSSRPQALTAVADGLADHDAVLGPATDGGWWALARLDPDVVRHVAEVAMSTAEHLRRHPPSPGARRLPGRPRLLDDRRRHRRRRRPRRRPLSRTPASPQAWRSLRPEGSR